MSNTSAALASTQAVSPLSIRTPCGNARRGNPRGADGVPEGGDVGDRRVGAAVPAAADRQVKHVRARAGGVQVPDGGAGSKLVGARAPRRRQPGGAGDELVDQIGERGTGG